MDFYGDPFPDLPASSWTQDTEAPWEHEEGIRGRDEQSNRAVTKEGAFLEALFILLPTKLPRTKVP